jgi:hypothetical protein
MLGTAAYSALKSVRSDIKELLRKHRSQSDALKEYKSIPGAIVPSVLTALRDPICPSRISDSRNPGLFVRLDSTIVNSFLFICSHRLSDDEANLSYISIPDPI